MLEWLAMPVGASAHAAEVDHIMVLVHWLMAALFAGWGIFFVWVLFRFRKGANPRASYTGAKGKLSKGLEIGIVVGREGRNGVDGRDGRRRRARHDGKQRLDRTDGRDGSVGRDRRFGCTGRGGWSSGLMASSTSAATSAISAGVR